MNSNSTQETTENRNNLTGKYVVLFKNPEDQSQHPNLSKFIGKCENFTPTGICAFSNEHSEILLVRYKDIVQMKLKKI